MLNVEIKYNPYTVKTDIVVDGVPVHSVVGAEAEIERASLGIEARCYGDAFQQGGFS